MDQFMIGFFSYFGRGRRLVALVLFAHLAAFSACAQDLQDPTRPPAILQQTSSGEVQSTGPVLQSILISPTRKLAMIDGVAFRLNEKFGTQTLVKITETEVVLRQGRSYQTLKLHPDFEKKSVRTHRKSNASTTRP